MGADRFLRFETGGDFFYALFQPALGGPWPLVVHTPGYGSEISLHPEIAFAGYNVLHIQPMGYMSPSGAQPGALRPQPYLARNARYHPHRCPGRV